MKQTTLLQSSQLEEPDQSSSIQNEIFRKAISEESSSVRKYDSNKMKQTTLLGKSGLGNKDLETSGKRSKSSSRKLTRKEMKVVKETSINIFDWLKPAKETMKKVDTEEPMEIVDREKEERLLRMQRRQQLWKTRQICSDLVCELVYGSVQEVTTKLCKEIVLENVVSIAWEELEVQYIMELMVRGGAALRVKVEERLRLDRELLEAEQAMTRQAQRDRMKKSKTEALKKLWRKKRLENDIKSMTEALCLLEIDDWEKELGQLMEMVEQLVLENPTLKGDDVVMVDDDELVIQEDILWDAEKMEVNQSECMVDVEMSDTEQPEARLVSMCTEDNMYSMCSEQDILCTQEQVLTVDCTLENEMISMMVSQPENPHTKPIILVTDGILSKQGLGTVHVSRKQQEHLPSPQTPNISRKFNSLTLEVDEFLCCNRCESEEDKCLDKLRIKPGTVHKLHEHVNTPTTHPKPIYKAKKAGAGRG